MLHTYIYNKFIEIVKDKIYQRSIPCKYIKNIKKVINIYSFNIKILIFL